MSIIITACLFVYRSSFYSSYQLEVSLFNIEACSKQRYLTMQIFITLWLVPNSKYKAKK